MVAVVIFLIALILVLCAFFENTKIGDKIAMWFISKL